MMFHRSQGFSCPMRRTLQAQTDSKKQRVVRPVDVWGFLLSCTLQNGPMGLSRQGANHHHDSERGGDCGKESLPIRNPGMLDVSALNVGSDVKVGVLAAGAIAG